MARKKAEEQKESMSMALALKELCDAKGLSEQVVIDAMSEALKKAYFKYSGDYPDSVIKVNIDLESGHISMSKIKNVVAEITDDVFETDPEEALEETGKAYQVGDVVETPIDITLFQRAAAMQAKNVFKQKLREAEKAAVVSQYADKVGDVLPGTIEDVEAQHCIVKIGHTSAYLSKKNVLPNEPLKVGAVIKVYVEEVVQNASGTPIIVSRTNPHFVTRLMEQDISEIYDGTVEIKGVSRIPGVRSKVAVVSKDPNVDPSGACIGPRGTRINRVLSQIPNEKIDVVNYNENPMLYVADALKPSTVIGVQMINDDPEVKACRVIVPDDQYSLAIGKEAQNVNLAVRLTGWKIDIKSETDALNNNYSYQRIEDIKFMEEAKKHASKTVTPVVEKAPVEEEVASTVNEDVVTPVVEETPVAEEVKSVVEPRVEEVVKPTPTLNTPNAFSELEAALSSSNKQEEAPKKKFYKKTEKPAEEEEVKKTTTPANSFVPQTPYYSPEELRELEQEEEEDTKNWDEYAEEDEFEKYYDEQ